jgi:hypothetical protein
VSGTDNTSPIEPTSAAAISAAFTSRLSASPSARRRRLRALTAVLAVCAFGVASVGVSGSTPNGAAQQAPPPAASR